MAKCITNNSSTNHHRTQHQMINDTGAVAVLVKAEMSLSLF